MNKQAYFVKHIQSNELTIFASIASYLKQIFFSQK